MNKEMGKLLFLLKLNFKIIKTIAARQGNKFEYELNEKTGCLSFSFDNKV